VSGLPADPGARDRALYERLCGYLSPRELDAVAITGERLVAEAGDAARLPSYKVMVAYGGGKDSTYVVAFVRAVQLHLRLSLGSTFALRVANMRHAGVPDAVMENIDRVYRALELLDDEQAELITVDHTLIRPFRRDLPLPERVREMNRLDVLMNGHRAAGDGRPTFCNSCNLAVADFYGRAAWWRGGVHAVMTGDSGREQRLYSVWIMRLAAECGLDIARARQDGFHGLLTALRGIGHAYFTELFGADSAAELAEREVAAGDRTVTPEFISIYDLVSYRVDDHWGLITDFLGFRFDDLALSFTESDCANPLLMAHLRGLRAQYVAGRSYAEGITEYLHLARELMYRKEMPETLIRLVLSRYDGPDKIAERRQVADEFAREAFGLNEDAFVAMVFSPFTSQGARLAAFVERCHPERSGEVAAMHTALRGEASGTPVAAWLESVSGLSLDYLRRLYASPLADFTTTGSVLARVRAGDPHKAEVATVDPATGEPVTELISGR
jgi:hypothetical protein